VTERALRKFVRERAAGYCEYCRLHQDYDRYYAFHVEHIVARQHGGSTDPANLAWSCHSCNLHKGPNLTGVDLTDRQNCSTVSSSTRQMGAALQVGSPILTARTSGGHRCRPAAQH